MSFFGKKKVTCDVIVHVLEKKKKEKRFMCWKKKKIEKKKVHVLEKRKGSRVGNKKKVENANSGKRGFGMRIQTHT